MSGQGPIRIFGIDDVVDLVYRGENPKEWFRHPELLLNNPAEAKRVIERRGYRVGYFSGFVVFGFYEQDGPFRGEMIYFSDGEVETFETGAGIDQAFGDAIFYMQDQRIRPVITNDVSLAMELCREEEYDYRVDGTIRP